MGCCRCPNISIVDWHSEVDCQSGLCQHLLQGVSDVVTHDIAIIRTLTTIVLHLWIFGKTPQHWDGFWPTVSRDWHELVKWKDWTTTEFDKSLDEVLPAKMPNSCGFIFVMQAHVDANHTSDSMTKKSCSAFLYSSCILDEQEANWCQDQPICSWVHCLKILYGTYPKHAMQIANDGYCLWPAGIYLWWQQIYSVQCSLPELKLQKMSNSIPYHLVYGDNKSVLYNASLPELMLQAKSNSIAYHFVWEWSSWNGCRLKYVNTHLNSSGILMKPLPQGKKRTSFVGILLHHVQDGMKWIRQWSWTICWENFEIDLLV